MLLIFVGCYLQKPVLRDGGNRRVCLGLQVVEKAVRRSMNRMQVNSLDCVQFHWWDYEDKRYLDALGHLADLQQEGLIRMAEVDTPITSLL